MCSVVVHVYVFVAMFCRNMDVPHLVEALRGKMVVDAACGSSHSACILDDGSLYTWGKGRYGRLGHNDHENQSKPKQVNFCLVYFYPVIYVC